MRFLNNLDFIAGPSRKPKRVSDVNALGTIPATSNSFMPIPTSYPNTQNPVPVSQAVYGAPGTVFNSGINAPANYGFTPQPG